jgi:hypothetical protein
MTVDIELEDLPEVDSDIGLGDEDKGKVQSNQLEWYKGEKGRTDRVALVYFNTVDTTIRRRVLQQKPDLTVDQQRTVIVKARAQLAERLGKSVDQLDQVDLLDTTEARFKTVTASFKKEVGYVAWPKVIPPGEEKIWAKAGERKDYVLTILLWYPTDREGDVDKDRLKHFRVLPWRFAPEKYDIFRKINKGLLADGSSISQIDLNFSCSDTQYQKISITPAGSAIYTKNPQLKRLVLEKAIAMYQKLNPFKEMTIDELREKLGMPPAGGGSGSSKDFSGEDFSNVLEGV